ncbi:MAG: hypothetical protein LW860_10845 [Xanthomonadaceae bacterium]|jgi:hypothetical protein|nr:hypothetical protein [Xanthomonadaceae bacterium]
MTMLRGVLAALSLVAPAVGAAPLVDRVQLAAGPYLADSALDVGLSLDPAALPDNVPSGPTDGRLVERGRSLRWEVSAALGESHAFRFGGFRVAGTAEGSTTRLLEDEGRPVVVDARARGDLALSAHGASWAWWLARDDERAWGIGLGLVRYALRTRVEGRLVVDGGPPGEGEARYAVDAIAPLLHIEYRRRLGADWRLVAEAAWVRKPRGALSGDATEASLGVEWLPHPHFGLGLRYAASDLDLRFERRAGTGRLGIRNHGPQLLAARRW